MNGDHDGVIVRRAVAFLSIRDVLLRLAIRLPAAARVPVVGKSEEATDAERTMREPQA